MFFIIQVCILNWQKRNGYYQDTLKRYSFEKQPIYPEKLTLQSAKILHINREDCDRVLKHCLEHYGGWCNETFNSFCEKVQFHNNRDLAHVVWSYVFSIHEDFARQNRACHYQLTGNPMETALEKVFCKNQTRQSGQFM